MKRCGYDRRAPRRVPATASPRAGRRARKRAALRVPADRPTLAGMDDRAAQLADAFQRQGQVADREVGEGRGVARTGSALVDPEAKALARGLPPRTGLGPSRFEFGAQHAAPEAAARSGSSAGNSISGTVTEPSMSSGARGRPFRRSGSRARRPFRVRRAHHAAHPRRSPARESARRPVALPRNQALPRSPPPPQALMRQVTCRDGLTPPVQELSVQPMAGCLKARLCKRLPHRDVDLVALGLEASPGSGRTRQSPRPATGWTVYPPLGFRSSRARGRSASHQMCV